MDTKDWILLFVPIIANGVLLFVFQKTISAKFDTQAKRRDLRLGVLDEFRNHVTEAIEAMNNIVSAINRGVDVSDEMFSYADKMYKLFDCAATYRRAVLVRYTKDIEKLKVSFDNCVYIINNSKEHFTREDQNSLIQNLKHNKEILHQILKKNFDLTV